MIDTNNLGIGKANPDVFERKDYAAGWNSALQAIMETAPTVDPESLPVVRELREQLAKVTEERDAARECLQKVRADILTRSKANAVRTIARFFRVYPEKDEEE